MSLVFGHADPALQRALLELCFSSERHDSSFRVTRIHKLDQALTDDTLSGEQRRVLPLFYKMNSLDGLSAASKAKVTSFYKYTWCRNSLMLNRLAQMKARFSECGFEPIIGLKGVSALSYLGLEWGVRPMGDVDILVPGLQKRPHEALTILKDMGFKKRNGEFKSLTVVSPEGLEFDIHWYLHDWALGDQLVQSVEEHAIECQIKSMRLLVPCLEHHLAHTLSHGLLTRTLTFDARWVFDFVAVYLTAKETTQGINVERFAEFANSVSAPQLIREGLDALCLDLPSSIDIDRQGLLELKNAVQTNSRFVSWLYKQTPIPNLTVKHPARGRRLDFFKQLMVVYWWTPRQIKFKSKVSFFNYYCWLVDFPAPSKPRALVLWIKKIINRSPSFLRRIFINR